MVNIMTRYHCARCSQKFEATRPIGKTGLPACPWCKNNHMVDTEARWEKFKHEVDFFHNKGTAAKRDARLSRLIKNSRSK
jgi:DNA-directed RNA polymerase subunit RPC12/RpoP